MTGWKVPLRSGKKKNQSSHLVDLGISKAALAKTKQKGEVVRRKRPVMQTIFIVALLSTLQGYKLQLQGDILALAPCKEAG